MQKRIASLNTRHRIPTYFFGHRRLLRRSFDAGSLRGVGRHFRVRRWRNMPSGVQRRTRQDGRDCLISAHMAAISRIGRLATSRCEFGWQSRDGYNVTLIRKFNRELS